MNAPLLLLNEKRQIVENSGNPDVLDFKGFFAYIEKLVKAEGIEPHEGHYMGFLAEAFKACENGDGVGQLSFKGEIVLTVLNVDKRGYALKQQGYKIPFGEAEA